MTTSTTGCAGCAVESQCGNTVDIGLYESVSGPQRSAGGPRITEVT
jgi:hypothetical protein